MYSTSQNYKDKIMLNATQHVLKIYIDDTEINQDHIKSFKLTTELFNNNEFCLGCTPEAQLEIEIDKDDLKDNYKIIKVETGISDEIIPLGTYIIQKPIETDEFTAKIKAVDYMSKFDINYDGSDLTYPQTLKQVLQDICKKVGVPLGTTTFLNEDKTIAVYDNSITARTYIGYIAEQAGGFAVIGRDGKLYIKKFGADTIDIDINLFKDFKYGDKLSVSKISYEDGVQNYKFGDEIRDTIYINQNNVYIVDSEQIQNIYNQLKDFEIYSFEGETIIDPAYDFGDILNINGKNVIYQGELIYEGKFVANIKSKIQAKTSQESMQTKESTSTKIKRVQSEIDQAEGKITQLVESNDQNAEKINEVNRSLDEAKSTISDVQKSINGQTSQITNLTQNADQVNITIQNIGGNNLIKNSDLACEDKKFWQSSFFQGYVESPTAPDTPTDNMFWYNTTENQMYMYYNNQWNKSDLTRKYVIDENNLMNYTTVYENNDTRRNTTSGRIIKTKLDLDADMPTTHCFIAPNLTDAKKGQQYLTLSFKVHNAIKTGLLAIFVGFIPVEIEQIYKMASSGNIPTIFEPSIILTPDEFTDSIQEHNSIKMTMKMPTKNDIKPCIVSTTLPTDTSKYWLAIASDEDTFGTLYQYSSEDNTYIPVTHDSSTEYFSVYDEDDNIWTFRQFVGAYYKTSYNYTYNSEPLSIGVGFGFYGGIMPLLSSQTAKPDKPNKGTYWLDETNDKTYRAKFDGAEFKEWEEITSQSPSWIKTHPAPETLFGSTTYVYPEGFYEFADLKLEYGNVATNWNRYPGEIYSNNVAIDEQGVHIRRNQQEMYIDEDEITALFNNNEVFKINGDKTYLKNIQTERINFDPFIHQIQDINGTKYYLFS